jgi:hypothetical protein
VIVASGIAATVAIEAGRRLMGAGLQRAAQDVDRGSASRMAAFLGRLVEHGPSYHLEIELSSGSARW